MIFEEEKIVLKKSIGRGYAKKVQKWLNDKGIKDSKEKPYTVNFITGVMNGYSHEILEKEIFMCANYYDSLAEKEAAKKEEIFQKLSKKSDSSKKETSAV